MNDENNIPCDKSELPIIDNVNNVNNVNNANNKNNYKNLFIGKVKKFDQKLYDKYDIPARKKIQEILGENVADNPDIYNEDMILNIPNCRYKYLELQVCAQWIDDKYPYSKPYVYARKSKFSDDTLFLIFNKRMTEGLLFSRPSLIEKPRRLKKYSRHFVYEAPWHRVMRINLDALTCETFELYS